MLSCGVISVILGLAIFVQLRLVTDRQTGERTDGQTHDESTYRVSIARVMKMAYLVGHTL